MNCSKRYKFALWFSTFCFLSFALKCIAVLFNLRFFYAHFFYLGQLGKVTRNASNASSLKTVTNRKRTRIQKQILVSIPLSTTFHNPSLVCFVCLHFRFLLCFCFHQVLSVWRLITILVTDFSWPFSLPVSWLLLFCCCLSKQIICKLKWFSFSSGNIEWTMDTLFCLIIITCCWFCFFFFFSFFFYSVNIICWFTWVSLFNNVLSIFLCSIFSDLTWACSGLSYFFF